MSPRRGTTGCAPAHYAFIAAACAAALLAPFDPRAALIPGALFLIACFTAPFMTRVGFFLPVTSRGRSGRRAVSLTFDDGPDPATTPSLLGLLRRRGVTATFFVTGERAAAHPDLVRLIRSHGHDIGNHTYHHSPLLMLRGSRHLEEEIRSAQAVLLELGIVPLAFRPPAGITNPRLGPVLNGLGLFCVNFSRRARDAGNRRIGNLSRKILARVRPDDIVLLHDVAPGANFDAAKWLDEIGLLLDGLENRRIAVIPLADLIIRPTMGQAGGAGPFFC